MSKFNPWSSDYNAGTEKKGFIDDVVTPFFNGMGNTSSGMHISPETAMRITTVYACVRVISESIGQLPAEIIKRERKGNKLNRELDYEHNLYKLFGYKPNGWQTPIEFFEGLIASCLLRGNSYSFINRSGDGRILELIPLDAAGVTVHQNTNYELQYQLTMPDGKSRIVKQADVFHVRNLGSNGFTGLSTITLHREALGLTQATQRHGSTMFGNGVSFKGLLEIPGKMDKDVQDRLSESFQKAFSGENQYKTPVLEQGIQFKPVSMSNEDSQFLETRKFQRTEIASVFRVPPHKIGDLERATFTNIEHQSLEFVIDTLMPWLKRIEQAVQRDLMPQRQINTHRMKFNVNALLRGDIKSRYEAYSTGLQWGFLSPNDVRQMEDKNDREGGDDYMVPMNMVSSKFWGKEPPKPAADPKAPKVEDESEEDKKFNSNVLKLLDHVND